MSDLLHLLTTAYGTSLHIASQKNCEEFLKAWKGAPPPLNLADVANLGVEVLNPFD
jgi:hypothetical protein